MNIDYIYRRSAIGLLLPAAIASSVIRSGQYDVTTPLNSKVSEARPNSLL